MYEGFVSCIVYPLLALIVFLSPELKSSMKCSRIAGGFTGWHWNHEIGSLLVAKWNGLRFLILIPPPTVLLCLQFLTVTMLSHFGSGQESFPS